MATVGDDELLRLLPDLDRSQIGGQRARVFAGKAEGRHIGMPAGQALAQPVCEIVEFHAIAKLAESWRRRLRACPGFADRVTASAWTLGQCQALPPEFARLAVFGRRWQCAGKVYGNCEQDRGQSLNHRPTPLTRKHLVQFFDLLRRPTIPGTVLI
jgi:hypothetical protein